MATCPVCKTRGCRSLGGEGSADRMGFGCDVCGEFWIPGRVASAGQHGESFPGLSPAIRQWFDEHRTPAEVGEPWELFVAAQTPPRGLEAHVDKLLLAIHRVEPRLGRTSAAVAAQLWSTRAWMTGVSELRAVLQHPAYGALFVAAPSLDVWRQGQPLGLGLTIDGKLRLEALGEAVDSGLVFLAYSYDDGTREPFLAGAVPAVESTGYQALGVEHSHTTDTLSEHMVGMIRRSRFMVADLTRANENVMWEAGFMTGLDRGVIYTAHAEQKRSRTPFNVRGYQRIDYADAEDLADKLQARIRALGWARDAP